MAQLKLHIIEAPEGTTHRFTNVSYQGVSWDLTHLDSFVFKADMGADGELTVLVLFSCHCFSHSFHWDPRARSEIPDDEIHDDGKEQRVLNPRRYALSQKFLRDLVMHLPSRHIAVASESQQNYLTLENVSDDGTVSTYAVFFEIERDKSRKRRLTLRIQSAYVLDQGLTKRQAGAKKVKLETLLRATFSGRKIRG